MRCTLSSLQLNQLLPLPTLLRPLLLLLFLLSLPSTQSSTKPRRSPPANSPWHDDPLLDSLLELAQAPKPHASSSSSSYSRSHSHSNSAHYHQNHHATPKKQQQQQQQQQEQQFSDGDFVYATGSCRERMPLARSTRAWRRGIRAFVLTDQDEQEPLERLASEGAEHNESYAFFPDDGDARLGGLAHGTKQGDARAALAPFAAHRHFGESYKWMLYGDDDTMFFMEPVKRMLSAFDPELPLALSDNLWYLGLQPNPHSPRCLPCHTANESLPTLEQLVKTPHVREHIIKNLIMARSASSGNVTEEDIEAMVAKASNVPGRLFVPTPGCPYCTPEKACNRDANPNVPCVPSVAHGGAGMIFSVGLMRSIAYRDALACLRGFKKATGGDAMVSVCLWHAGVGFTDPGPLVRHMYDPHYVVFSAKAGQGYLWDPIGMISHGRCNSKCRWMLRNTLTLHVKGRHFRSWRVGAVLMWGVAHGSEAALSFLDLTSRDGGVHWKQLPYGYDIDDAEGFAPYMTLAAPPAPARAAATAAGTGGGE